MATFQTTPNGRTRVLIRRPTLHASKTFDRLADARVWARAKEREADLEGVVVAKADGTLGDLLARYEREIWPIKKWGSSKAYELKQLDADIGATPLATLNKAKIVDYAQTLAKRMGRAGVMTRLSYLRSLLTTARDLWHVPAPVAALDDAVVVLRHHKVVGRGIERTRRQTPEEIAAIIATAQAATKSTIDLAEIVRILDVLPLRIGELLDIQWDDLRPAERAVVIRSRKHPDRVEKEINTSLVPLIKVADIDTYELIAGRPRYFERPFPYDRTTVSSAFWLAALRARVEDLHLHDLRAGAISSLFEAGIGIPLVALISGHRNWKVLQRHYSRVKASAVHAAIANAGK